MLKGYAPTLGRSHVFKKTYERQQQPIKHRPPNQNMLILYQEQNNHKKIVAYEPHSHKLLAKHIMTKSMYTLMQNNNLDEARKFNWYNHP
jgi:hypothetical protein